MTPQNTTYSIWAVALKQWNVFQGLSSSEQEDISSFVVFWSGYSAMYLTRRDEVCGLGNNGAFLNLLGLTGDEFREDRADRPVEIKALSNKGIVSISLGVYVGAALDREGWLYWWGLCGEEYGEIRTPNLASNSPRYNSVCCGAMFIAALSNDGWVYVWGRFWNSEKYFKELPLLTGYVTSLSCGLGHLAMVTNDGQAYTWGDGRNGQRGFTSYRYPSHDDIVRKVETELLCSGVKCGGHSTLLLSNAGELWATGANDSLFGYLGVLADEKEVTKPCKVQLTEIIVEFVAGWSNTLLTTYAALTENGNVYVWGRTATPQLVTSAGTSLVANFLGDPTPRETMIQVRPPALVPATESERAELPKSKSSGNIKYLNVLRDHFSFLY